MIELALACVAIFTYVAAKAFQQRNVAGNHYIAIMPLSIIMICMEFYVVGFIALTGFSIVKGLALGVSGGVGCILSMLMHNRIFHEKAEAEPAHQGPRPTSWGHDRDGGKYPIYAIRTGSGISGGESTPPDSPPIQRALESHLIRRGVESLRGDAHDCSGWFKGCVVCMDRIMDDYKRRVGE